MTNNNPISTNTTNKPNGKKIYDIHLRIYHWVISVINLTKKLPRTIQNEVVIRQVTASVTSVGANDNEANASDSKKDFISKYVIVRKECKETIYWLNVIKDTNKNFLDKDTLKNIDEGIEIGKIISTIIRKTKKQ